MSDRQTPRPSQRIVVSILGCTQILAWGSSYYLLAVLGPRIAQDTHWPLAFVVAGLSFGLLVAGSISPAVGRLIQRRGGRIVLLGSSVLLGLGLILLAMASNRPSYLVAWAVLGLGMGSGLYDAAFATLGHTFGERARSAITSLTLFGGFASTVSWSLSSFLVERMDWRTTCLTYAAIQLLVSTSLHFCLSKNQPSPTTKTLEKKNPTTSSLPKGQRATFGVLAVVLTCNAFVFSMLSVHLLTFLQLRGLSFTTAVSLGALLGPAQVAARIVEKALGQQLHPNWTMLVSVILMAVGLGLLLSPVSWLGLSVTLYGAGAGLNSIARGTVPLALFGPAQYAELLGKLALPSLLVQGLTPAVGALLLQRPEGISWALGMVSGSVLLSLLLSAFLSAAAGERSVSGAKRKISGEL